MKVVKKIFKRFWKSGVIFIVLMFVASLSFAIGAQEDYPTEIVAGNPSPGEGEIEASPDQIIVKYKDSTSAAEEQKIEQTEQIVAQEEIKPLDAQILELPDDKNSHQAVSEFREEHGDDIEYAELDAQLAPLYTPNDSGYASQWALPKISAPTGWDITRGSSSVKIAVLDTGVNVNHPDLKNKLAAGWNAVDNNTDLTDLHGHGTMMMGVAGAQTGNSAGMAGVGIEPKIMMVRISNNAYGWAYTSDMAKAVIYAADHGAKVISISFGGSFPSATMQNAIDYAYNKGSLITAAAGNSGSNSYMYPAAYNHVIAVGATTSSDQKASFSNWGSWVDVTAPGASIYTTTKDGGYAYVSGTSPATPHVAGLAALLFSQKPDLTPAQAENYIIENIDDLGASGKDDIFGYGRININKALVALTGQVPAPPADGLITGKITHASSKNPIVAAKVTVLQNGSAQATVWSAADGTYTVDNLTPGTYDIMVTAQSFETASQTGVTVSSGQTTTVNLALKPSGQKGSIKGTVLNYDKKPMYKATVELKLVSTPIPKTKPIRKTVRTDKKGRFAFEDLPEGNYSIRTFWNTQFAQAEIHIFAASTTTVNLQLSKTNTLRYFKKLLKGW